MSKIDEISYGCNTTVRNSDVISWHPPVLLSAVEVDETVELTYK